MSGRGVMFSGSHSPSTGNSPVCDSPQSPESSPETSPRTTGRPPVRRLHAVCLCVGGCQLVLGLVLTLAMGAIVSAFVHGTGYISEDMPMGMYDAFKNPTSKVDMSIEFHMWNVTNPDAVMRGDRPVFTPVGPIVYRLKKPKGNITFSDDGEIVNYTYRFYYEFDAENSAIDPHTTKVTTVNLPVWGTLYKSTWLGLGGELAGKQLVDAVSALSGVKANFFDAKGQHNLYHELATHTVHEWIFGFEHPLVSTTVQLFKMLSMMQRYGPIVVPDRFAVQYNDSKDYWNHTTSMHTGKSDWRRAGQLATWEGRSTVGPPSDPTNPTYPAVEYWGPGAQAVSGSDGTLLQLGLNKGDSYELFVDALWRRLRLSYDGDGGEVKGIRSWAYKVDPAVWKNANEDPRNAPYMQFGPTGALNLSSAQQVPFFVTRPNFAGAAAWHEGAVLDAPEDFLNPSRWAERLRFEPTTGAPLEIDLPLMFSVRVSDMTKERDWPAGCVESGACPVNMSSADIGADAKPATPFSLGMHRAHYPLITARQRVLVGDSLANTLRPMLTLSYVTEHIIGPILIALSSASVLFWSFVIVRSRRTHYLPLNPDREPECRSRCSGME